MTNIAPGGIIYAADIEGVGCVLRDTTGQSVANNGANLTWNTEDLDTYNWHDPSTNPSRITPTIAGWYNVKGTVHLAGSATSHRRAAAVRLNGGTLYYGNLTSATINATQGNSVEHDLFLNGTTDYVEIFAYQNSGAALAVADTTSTRFAVWLTRRT